MRVLRQLLESVTRTATGSDTSAGGGDANLNYEGRDISDARGPIEIYVYVFAMSGSGGPTLVVQANDGFELPTNTGSVSAANGAIYRSSVITSPPTITSTGLYLNGTLNDYGTLLGFSWTITGTTPSFTFEIWIVYETAD
jgi:hypothetical protein